MSYYNNHHPLAPPSTSRTGTRAVRPSVGAWVASNIGSRHELKWLARNLWGFLKFVVGVVVVVAMLYVLLGAK